MNQNQNLEALIENHANIMAKQMIAAVTRARSEEDIRHECNKLIDEFIEKAGLTVEGRHEYGLAGGHIDSKYGGVVIEYKNPKGSGKITEDKNAPGVKAVVAQLNKRFRDFQAEEHVGMERILGVGCDGDTIVFVRKRGTKLDAEAPQPVTPHTVQRLLRAIISLGARGLSFTPENLASYFGSEGQSAQKGVQHIHALIHATDNPKAQMFFSQWQILFGEVCGYDIHGQNAKVKKLADHYDVPNSDPAELLFAVHTYYAIFMKMLAAEIVSSFSPLGISTLKKLISAPTSAKLRDELHNLEQGGIWSQIGIRNFLEGDLFSWYLDAWNEDCADAVRTMTQALDQFDPTTLSVDPAESRDLLKQLYQQLFPKSVRHDLGEYYTPDWLAELVLDELGYDGDPDKRLLDPACGSGTFLVMALNRVKTWYDEHRYECGFGEDELLQKILRNIIGFDLNPLAVMAARTNYLMAIRELLRHADNIELPVYLYDSIMTNAFAPLFIGKVDYVAGNPPWVNWESLPNGYRDAMKSLWQEYNLFTLSGTAGRLGGGKKDISMLFTYIAVDNYLKKAGRLGFVITQSVFKTQGAGDGFRQLRYTQAETSQSWYLQPLMVHDLSAMQVFEGATNRTAVFVCEKKKKPFQYPVEYTIWTGASRIAQDESLSSVLNTTKNKKIKATPVVASKASSPWLTAPRQVLSGIQKVIGQSDYKAYEGVNTGGLNGSFWIQVLKKLPNGELLIENLHDVGRIKVDQVQAVIEPDLVYPLLRGRDVQRWYAEPSEHIILAQDPHIRKGIPETEMKRRWPKTYAYLKQFEGDPKKPERGTLRGRSGYRRYFKETDPFYSMYNVGPYTMVRWKVVWREQSSMFQAAFAGSRSRRVILPDHKLMMVPCASRQEADFLLGMLNSRPSLLAISSYVIATSTSTHVLSNVAVPRFKKAASNHTLLAELSRQCHVAANNEGQLAALEADIDEAAAKIWGITKTELKAIQKALSDL